MKFLRGFGTVVGASVGLFVAVGATVGACGGGGETTASAGSSGSTTTASATGTGGTAASSTGAGMGGGTTGSGESTSSATTGAGGTGGMPPVVKYDCTPPAGNAPALKLTEVAMGIKRPVLVKGIPGDDTRLFVLGQDGKIWIIKDGALLPTPFLDISAIVHQPSAGDERGLLGMAFHPKYAQNGRFFLYYTDNVVSPGDQHLAEYKRSANSPDLADPTAVQVMFNEPDAESNHNGGALEFSPLDGYLYVGMGDGGGAGDVHGTFGNSQNLASRWGKILRLDVDSAMKPYGIPAGNLTAVPVKDPNDPAMGNPSDPAKVNNEIWDFGLRNPWRFSFDLCTNDLYIGDVGQNKWEEVDVEPAGKGNKNYGWRLLEGTHDFKPEGYTTAALVPPVAEYPHGPECSITGGYVYRGKAIPGLRGAYIYGDYCTGKIWTLSWANGVTTMPVTHPEINPGANLLVSFGQDNLGEIYVLALNGHVFRVDAQ
jgi:glucose/arabinose dehydrogenase